eukprot:scaffold145_cov261-Pinguiococcus_pyrenoidosus.AAC.15
MASASVDRDSAFQGRTRPMPRATRKEPQRGSMAAVREYMSKARRRWGLWQRSMAVAERSSP